jgi:hypothetical protein
MNNLATRLKRLELDTHRTSSGLSRMRTEELRTFVGDVTKEKLRVELRREPTSDEIAKDIERLDRYLSPLSTMELAEIRDDPLVALRHVRQMEKADAGSDSPHEPCQSQTMSTK